MRITIFWKVTDRKILFLGQFSLADSLLYYNIVL